MSSSRGPVIRAVAAAFDRRPVVWSCVLTALWLVLVHASAEVLVAGADGVEGDLRMAAVNAVAVVLPLSVLAALGWRSRGGLGRGGSASRWRLLFPLALGAMFPLVFGVAGRSADVLLAGALLFLVLGVNEEVMFRGLIQGIWARRSAAIQCAAVAVIFGLQHSSNLLWGQDVIETAEQVLSSSAFGLAYAAARLHIGSVWPLAVLHAMSNFCKTLVPGDMPELGYVVVAIALAGYGLILIRAWQRRHEPDRHPVHASDTAGGASGGLSPG